MRHPNRREFLRQSALATAATLPLASLSAAPAISPSAAISAKNPALPFRISLAQWSLHREIFAKKMDNLDFAKVAKQDLGISAIEYVNQFFFAKATDKDYLKEMKARAEGEGVTSLLIMIDREGNLGDPDEKKRKTAVENHHKWVEAAKFLGCHSIRVNARSAGSFEEQQQRAADGLRQLTEFAADHEINVIVENHGGLSSNGEWLAGVMKKVDLPRCGTLPDFGNFRISKQENYDNYKGVDELMPFAKAVSAKSYGFDDKGNETTIDYPRMMDIVVKKHDYRGYVGIEFEGRKVDEKVGIKATRDLLISIREKMQAEADS